MLEISLVHQGCLVHREVTMSKCEIHSTLGEYNDSCGGYQKYTGGSTVDIMNTSGGYHDSCDRTY